MGLTEFEKLPLEERARVLLKVYNGELEVKAGFVSSIFSAQALEASRYIQDNKYLEIVGGTPKSGLGYKITEKGYEFMKD